MRTRQLHRILGSIMETRIPPPGPILIIVNGVAFPIMQRFSISKDMLYLVADTNPKKGEIVGMPFKRKIK